jgi:two-component system sensor histidine kinase TctE
MPDSGSLRQLLTRWLIGPLVAVIIVSVGASYYIALDAANDAYDNALLDPAIAIGNRVHHDGNKFVLDLPAIALDALRTDSEDKMMFQVIGPQHALIAGSGKIPLPPARVSELDHMFFDAKVDGERMRAVALTVRYPTGLVLIEVAETLVKRDRLVSEILLASALPALLISGAAIALFWFGIGKGLEPLDRLREEVAERSPRDLRPVVESGKPREITPLVHALNQLLARLNAAIEAQQRFIANAAHQLRTPLAGLKTHAELARRQPNTLEMRSLLDMIAGETERTSHLVNQLLTLARTEPGAGGLRDRQPVNLHDVVSRVVQDWVPRAVAKDIDLGFELVNAWTVGESFLLRELLANLLDNAINYTQSGGTITVRTIADPDHSILEVEDNGPGIAPAEREKVFERFYRAAATPGDGCGLGLAIVAEIATQHGGTVEIATPPQTKGAVMRVRLPKLSQHALSESMPELALKKVL